MGFPVLSKLSKLLHAWSVTLLLLHPCWGPVSIKFTRIFQLKNQALCQYKYGSLYHVIQLPVMTSDWKRMNKRVVNNVHLKKKKKTLIAPTPVPSPGGKGGGLRFRHVKVHWVYLKLEIPFLFMSVSIYAFFNFYFEIKSLCYIVI
jgi:hypothetical protein